MIKKLKTKFITVAMLSISALLILILAVINIVNFSLVISDADSALNMITKNDTGHNFNEPPTPPNGLGQPGNKGQMGPKAPDTQASYRYFKTIINTQTNEANIVEFSMSAINKEEAKQWAISLTNNSKGFTRGSYRFLVTTNGQEKIITILDIGRELLPSLNVLYASIIGSVVGLIITLIAIIFVSNKFVKPIIESDRKQKLFISEASREIKDPLTSIAIDKDLIKKEIGENDITKSIDKNVDRLFNLTLKLNELLIFEQSQIKKEEFNICEIINFNLKTFKQIADKKGININFENADNVLINSDKVLINKLFYEVFDNAVKFAKTKIYGNLEKNDDRIIFTLSNDADNLPKDIIDNRYDRVFERFYKQNVDFEGNGLGLSIAKEIVSLNCGRILATVNNDIFTIKIEL